MKNENLNWLQKLYHNTYSENKMTAFWSRLGVVMISFGVFLILLVVFLITL